MLLQEPSENACSDQIGLTPQSHRVTLSGLSLFGDFAKSFQTNFLNPLSHRPSNISSHICVKLVPASKYFQCLHQIEIFEISGKTV